jgi:hypothetical protein
LLLQLLVDNNMFILKIRDILDSKILFCISVCQFVTTILYMDTMLPLIFIILDIIIGLFYQNFVNLTNNINNFIESIIPSYY